jgi:hypothetical protein
MPTDLLPCPCCGAPAHFFKIDDTDSRDHGGEGICCGRSDLCLTTGLMFACGEDVKPMLAETWNRRAAQQPVQEGDAEAITDERIDEALEAWFASGPVGMEHKTDRKRMRAAIDAAINAQGEGS